MSASENVSESLDLVAFAFAFALALLRSSHSRSQRAYSFLLRLSGGSSQFTTAAPTICDRKQQNAAPQKSSHTAKMPMSTSHQWFDAPSPVFCGSVGSATDGIDGGDAPIASGGGRGALPGGNGGTDGGDGDDGGDGGDGGG
jgi:hypothetical protein